MRQILKQSDFLVGLVKASRALPRDFQRSRQRRRSRQQFESYLKDRQGPRGLQIGSGKNDLPGWLNSDLFPRHREQVFLDAAKEFPIPDDSFDHIFSEHVIEHLTFREGQVMLSESLRILKPGGTVRIATPDLSKIAALAAPEKDAARTAYIEAASRRYVPENTALLAGFVINNFYWDFGHYFVYDADTLRFALEKAGFAAVRRCESGESRVPSLEGIERHGSVIGDHLDAYETFIMEADTPG